MITAIVTCMGRLAHLQATLPALLQGQTEVCVVDYSCPDGCGDWVEETFGEPGVYVERVEGRSIFNKPEALNYGAARAIEQSPDTYLLFVDADTITTPELWAWIGAAGLHEDRFYFVEGAAEHVDSTGLLLVQGAKFAASGGYDERMRGWGAEDLDMRLRLFFKMRLGFAEMPSGIIRSLPHEDAVRVAHYEEKDRSKSHEHNLLVMAENVKEWAGIDLHEALSAVRLLGLKFMVR